MADNFLACDRDQAFLLPPDLHDWLPADHLAWFILDVVDQLDLGPFLAAYRADGHGRAAYQPRMLAVMACRGPWPAGPSGWPGCNTPRPSWKPRPPPASSATSSG